MAKQNNIEFKVGVTILIGIISLAGSLYWLQGYKLELNSRRVMVEFGDVGTLTAGDPVTVSGVRKGKVTDLTLTRLGVLVELMLYKDVVLRRDASFTIKNLGVMGERFIAVNPGEDSLLFDTAAVIAGQYDTGLPEVMGIMGDMIIELKSLVSSMNKTVTSEGSLEKFTRAASNLEEISSTVLAMLEKNDQKFTTIADNFLDASEGMKRIVSKNEERVDSTLGRMDRLSGNLESIVSQLDSLAASARKFAAAMEDEEGSLQLLMRDRRLYDDLRKTADNIDDLVLDIKANPHKYINLQVKLF